MLLSFNKVHFSYNSLHEVLKGISFEIDYGEKVALLGLNGSGKSTLMLLTNGLLLPDKGDVFVKGMSSRSKFLNEIRKTVGLVFQNPDDQLFMPTVRDDVAFGPRNMKLTEEEVHNKVNEALYMTNTFEFADRHPFDLSGGQKKAVAIATVLAMNPELIVMDEPTSGLDYIATNNFIEIVESLSQTFLISTHDLGLAKRLCNRAIVLKEGRIEYDGDISSYHRQNPQ